MHTDAHLHFIDSLSTPESCQSPPMDPMTLKLTQNVTVSFEGTMACGSKNLVIRHNDMATQRIVIGERANVRIVDVLSGDMHEKIVHSFRMNT